MHALFSIHCTAVSTTHAKCSELQSHEPLDLQPFLQRHLMSASQDDEMSGIVVHSGVQIPSLSIIPIDQDKVALSQESLLAPSNVHLDMLLS